MAYRVPRLAAAYLGDDMAINFTDFSKAKILDSPAESFFENVLKGYKISQEPGKMADEKKQRELVNSLKEKALAHKDKEYSLSDALKEAQINKANQPTGLKGALAAAFQLRNNLNPDDPNYQKDFSAINNYITNLGSKNGMVPQTAPGEGIKINLPEGKQGYVPGLGKLKPGWQAVKDAEGNDIGVNVPMSDKQVDQWKAKEKFDVIYPFLNQSLGEYSGKGSWERFVNDAKNYNTDAKAKQRIDNFYAAKSLLSIGSTTENARIGGHATNVQLRELKNTLDKSEVHQKLEKGSGFVLPKQYAKNSGDIFKNYLDKVENTAKTNIPAYEFRALNPEKNDNSVAQGSSQNENPEIISEGNGFATIKNGNKILKIPTNLVDRYMIEHSKPELGDDYGR